MRFLEYLFFKYYNWQIKVGNGTCLRSYLYYSFPFLLPCILPISTVWFLGGKQVVYWYGRSTISPMIEQGINPGIMEYQPFK